MMILAIVHTVLFAQTINERIEKRKVVRRSITIVAMIGIHYDALLLQHIATHSPCDMITFSRHASDDPRRGRVPSLGYGGVGWNGPPQKMVPITGRFDKCIFLNSVSHVPYWSWFSPFLCIRLQNLQQGKWWRIGSTTLHIKFAVPIFILSCF